MVYDSVYASLINLSNGYLICILPRWSSRRVEIGGDPIREALTALRKVGLPRAASHYTECGRSSPDGVTSSTCASSPSGRVSISDFYGIAPMR